MEAPAAILAGLVAIFSHYVTDLESPEVTWFDPRMVSGKTNLGETDCGYRISSDGTKQPFCRIKLNTCLVGNPSELIDTYLHELAHYVDWMSDEDWDNHGGQWKMLTRQWKLVSSRPEVNNINGCDL